LGHDVVAVADTVQDRCAECGFVERDRFARVLDPQLRLDTRVLSQRLQASPRITEWL
jgi:hypothetical protein